VIPASLLLVAALAQLPNAWIVWATPDPDLARLDDGGWAGDGLQPDSQVPLASLDRAARATPTLDAAVSRLRRGLAFPRCERDPSGGVLEPLRLAKAALARALVGVRNGEPPAPHARLLVAYGRRLARCDGGGLLLFVVGQHVEGLGLTFMSWAAHWGLGRPPVDLAAGALGWADLARALDFERDTVLRLLPDETHDGATYSRRGSETLIRSLFAQLEAVRRASDLEPVRQRLAGLLDDRERAVFAETALPEPRWASLKSFGRDNLVGRWIASRTIPPAVGACVRPIDRLARGDEEPPPPPGAGAPAGGWIDRGATTVDEAPVAPPAGVAPPEPGRCRRLSQRRYRFVSNRQAATMDVSEALAQAARVVPHFQDGGVDGFMVLSVRPDSWVASCGVENRDLVLSVNGRDVRDPAAALDAIEAVRAAGRLDLVVVRAGRRVAFTVEGEP